jgi:hypothetical protein
MYSELKSGLDREVCQKDAILTLICEKYHFTAFSLLIAVAYDWAKAGYAYKGVEICERLLENSTAHVKRDEIEYWQDKFQKAQYQHMYGTHQLS